MIISHKHRFIFIKTAKTAGTSIETFLSPFCGEEDVLTPFGREEKGHIPRNYSGFWNHIPGHKIRSLIPKKIWDNYFKFCVERNPWDKAISHYHFFTKRHNLNLTFDEYLAQGYSCVNYPKYTESTDSSKIIVDKVIKYEKLQKELGVVFGNFSIPFDGDLNIRAKGNFRTDRRPYQEVLNDNQRKIIAQTYAKEIQLFNYEF